MKAVELADEMMGVAVPAVRPPRTLRAEIAALLDDFSIEKTPAEVAALRALPLELPRGSQVYITWIAGNAFERTLRAAVRLRELGMRPVPHLAARAIADPDALGAMLGALQREAAVDHALLVAGSMRMPIGRFEGTLPALACGLFERHGWRALADKNAYAGRSSLQMHLVTQFCFDGAPLVAWERRIRAAGNALPIHVGLAGLASLPTLIKYARHCGVGASLGVLTRQAGRLFKLAAAVAPGEVVTALAAARVADPQCLIERVHFFPFGSFDATVAWAARVGRGEFRLVRDDTDIAV